LVTDRKDIAFGYIYLTAQNIISVIIGVLGYSLLVRSITQEEIGVLAGLTLLGSFFQILSSLGLGSSLAKFISELMGRRENTSSYLLSAVLLVAASASSLSLLLLLFPEWFSILLFKTPYYSPVARLLSLHVLLPPIVMILNSFLLGAGRLKAMAYCGVALTSVTWLVIVLLLLKGFGIMGVVLGWIVGDIVGVILYSISILRSRALDSDLGNLTFNFTTISRLIRFSMLIYISSLASFLYSYYDRAVVLALLPLSDVGIYDVVNKVFSVFVAFTTPFASALFPYYGSAYGRNEHEQISSVIRRASKYSALLFAPLALILFSTSNAVITLFAGQEYEGGYTVLAILSLFALTYAISPALSNLLLIYGKTLTILLLSLIPVALSLSIIPFISYLGLNGLAFMKGLSILIGFILSLYTLSKVVKIRFDKVALIKIFSSSVIMALIIILIEGIYYSKFLLPLYIGVGGGIYILSLRLLRVIDEQDVSFLNQVFGTKMGLIISKIFYKP
jgi:polysaccharide transporter, PST family